jgi:hypothetical protein
MADRKLEEIIAYNSEVMSWNSNMKLKCINLTVPLGPSKKSLNIRDL